MKRKLGLWIKMKDKKAWISIMFLCVFSICLITLITSLYFRFENTDDVPNVHRLTDGWSYYIEPISDMLQKDEATGYISMKPNEVMVSTRIIKEEVVDPTILFIFSYQRMEVFLEDELVFSNKNQPAGENPGYGMGTVSLPENYLGKKLRVEVSSPYELYAYSPNSIYLGSRGDLEDYTRKSSTRSAFILFVLVVSGVLAIVFSVVVSIQNPQKIQWSSFFFGIISIFVGSDIVSVDYFFLQTFTPLEMSDIIMVPYFLLLIPVILYLYHNVTICKKAVGAVLVLVTGSLLVVFSLDLLQISELPNSLSAVNTIYFVSLICMAMVVVREWFHKNKLIRFITPCLGFFLTTATLSAIDIGRFYEIKELSRIIGFALLFLLIWIFHLKEFFGERSFERKEILMLQMKNELILENHEIMQESLEETSLLRHEMKHHVAMLLTFSKDKEEEKLERYLEEIAKSTLAADPVIYCENPLVNSIFSQYNTAAKKYGIQVEYEIYVPKKVPILDSDLCTLLMNILDNALEACLKIHKEERWSKIQIKKKESFLVVSCQNAKSSKAILEKNGRFATTKEDAASHGYGILAMEKVVQKYRSKLNITYDERQFSVKTILPLD